MRLKEVEGKLKWNIIEFKERNSVCKMVRVCLIKQGRKPWLNSGNETNVPSYHPFGIGSNPKSIKILLAMLSVKYQAALSFIINVNI